MRYSTQGDRHGGHARTAGERAMQDVANHHLTNESKDELDTCDVYTRNVRLRVQNRGHSIPSGVRRARGQQSPAYRALAGLLRPVRRRCAPFRLLFQECTPSCTRCSLQTGWTASGNGENVATCASCTANWVHMVFRARQSRHRAPQATTAHLQMLQWW